MKPNDDWLLKLSDVDKTAIVNGIGKLCRVMRKGIISFDEFADNVIVSLVRRDRNLIHRCLNELANELAIEEGQKLVLFARQFLESCDFMPTPVMFFAHSPSPKESEQKRIEMRPQYIQLLKYLEDSLAELPPS